MYQSKDEPANRVRKGIETYQHDGVLVIRDDAVSDSAWILSDEFEGVRR